MTSSDLHAMVSKWPESARADGIDFCGRAGFETALDEERVISLHEISGLRWMAKGGLHVVSIEECGDGTWSVGRQHLVTDKIMESGVYPTIISAIDAAIRAVEGEA